MSAQSRTGPALSERRSGSERKGTSRMFAPSLGQGAGRPGEGQGPVRLAKAVEKMPHPRSWGICGLAIGDGTVKLERGSETHYGASRPVWEARRVGNEVKKTGKGGGSLYLGKAASRPSQSALPDRVAPNPRRPAPAWMQESAPVLPGRSLFAALHLP